MASPFPITIDKVSLGYTRGSSDKEYHLVLIQAANGKKMFISRFGKRGTWGTMDVDYSPSAPAMFQKKLNEKSKRYTIEHQAMGLSSGNLSDFRSNLGDAYWHKLSPAQREHILGAGEPELEITFPGTPAPAPEPAKPLTEAERYANNPLWGAF